MLGDRARCPVGRRVVGTVSPMELTPKVFDDVEFRERFRGYDPDEVDAFLEQVARAVQELDQKLKDAQTRAEKAEARAREAGDADEALRRTLVLAQRTADAAVSEAETRAAALLAEAEGKAATTIADAERQAAVSRGEAEAYALRTRDVCRRGCRGQGRRGRGARRRDARRRRARRARRRRGSAPAVAHRGRARSRRCESGCAPTPDGSRRHIAIQRQRVLATVEALQHITTDPDALREAPVPEFKAVDVPPTAEAMGGGAPPAPPAPPPAVHAADDVDAEAASTSEDAASTPPRATKRSPTKRVDATLARRRARRRGRRGDVGRGRRDGRRSTTTISRSRTR